jgi:hypothetical protein
MQIMPQRDILKIYNSLIYGFSFVSFVLPFVTFVFKGFINSTPPGKIKNWILSRKNKSIGVFDCKKAFIQERKFGRLAS